MISSVCYDLVIPKSYVKFKVSSCLFVLVVVDMSDCFSSS